MSNHKDEFFKIWEELVTHLKSNKRFVDKYEMGYGHPLEWYTRFVCKWNFISENLEVERTDEELKLLIKSRSMLHNLLLKSLDMKYVKKSCGKIKFNILLESLIIAKMNWYDRVYRLKLNRLNEELIFSAKSNIQLVESFKLEK